jgi:4-hydroxy-4-methyl-2-oxoglutarate aldolase
MMKVALFMGISAVVWGQPGGQARPAPPPSAQYLKARVYTAEEDEKALKLFDRVRVADVIDALDVVGLQGVTTMDRSIRPLWRDEQKLTHRIRGAALTLRLVPAQETSPRFDSHAAERTWEAGGWGPPPELRADAAPRGGGYGRLIRPGTILVVENNAIDNGFCGSNNGLAMTAQGLRGLVGNAVCRDNDELIVARVPVYQNAALAPRGINQGRMWMESYNQPVVVGQVLVMPGDIIVADSDGVAVVPRAKAEQVAEIAYWIYADDEIKRAKIFDNARRPRDFTVEGVEPPPPPSDKPIHKTPVWQKK